MLSAFNATNDHLLITGDLGFVGQHALARWPGARGFSEESNNLDIRDKSGLTEFFRGRKLGAILHLAALSFVPDSFKDPETTFAVNFLGTLNLLEALADSGFSGRFLFISTGDAYGLVPQNELPITENRPLRPRNPYGVSKAAAEALCYQWSQTGPFEIVIARPFNHIGPGQAPTFAISDFARQIALIKAGKLPPALTVGNIETTRDFTDVSDVLAAYGALLEHGHNGEIYNVGSGIERSVRSLLEQLLELANVKAEIIVDPLRFRPAEQARVCCSHDKLTQHTGWQPAVPIEQTLLNLYHYWENEIGK